MILCFELSMPGRNSWNGQWSGDGNSYAKVVNFGRSKKAEAKAHALCEQGSFYFSFGDGWAASVRVREVDASEARRMRRLSRGFCDYDWMVDSILRDGFIIPAHATAKGAAHE